MKKAVFFDIDGTLWDEKRRIPKSTVEAVNKLRENGHYAFICSGRSKVNIHAKELLEIGFDGILAGCGTYAEYNGKVIIDEKIPQDKLQKALEILEEFQLPVVLEGSRYAYMHFNEFTEDDFVEHMKISLGEQLLPISGNQGKYDVNKMSANYTQGNLNAVTEALKEDYDMIVHEEKVVEIVPKGFSKATGIQKICQYLNIDRKNTYAFGDSINDIEMLDYVEKGIAMGNGSKVAKDAADYVTAPLHEDGIYQGLEYFALI